ncbi:MAG: gliding motility-associated C-terminal domain-containing protein [Vicingaceae bacterium]
MQKCLQLESLHSNSLEIIDRWGNIVFRSDNYSNDWNGGEQPGGTYFYVLKVGDSENSEHKGTLTIIR